MPVPPDATPVDPAAAPGAGAPRPVPGAGAPPRASPAPGGGAGPGDLRAPVVVIGAGIVGCALADELTTRGWSDVTVLDQGPLPSPGGSTSHAPGLVFRLNPSRTMTRLAAHTVERFTRLGAFDRVGGLEVATTGARLTELHRRAGLAASWGIGAEVVGPGRCRELWPLLRGTEVVGGLHTPDDGVARALDAAGRMRRRAAARGARFLDRHTVTGIERSAGRVTAVVTDRGSFPAERVVCAAGFWGPLVGALAGVRVPLLPLAHQYATTRPLDRLPQRLPILRHQGGPLYFRRHGTRIGIGSYAHRPLPVDPAALPSYDAAPVMPSALGFTPEEWAPAWDEAVRLLPALADAGVGEGFNGVFSFTPDGLPLLGESPDLGGFWLAEAVWVTHSAGAARAVVQWMTDGRPALDLHECDPARFEQAQLTPAYIAARGARSFAEVYDIVHPLQPPGRPRPLRTSPFHARQRELGAYFLEGGGWERPHWYEANAPLVTEAGRPPERDDWSARHWSPIAAAEARTTREGVALYDMTPLRRLRVSGPGALDFLQRMTTNQLAKPPGSVTCALLLDHAGGIRSDLTVARLGEREFQLGANTPADLGWLLRHAPPGVRVQDLTPGTCCVGVWGPLAHALVQPLTDDDFPHRDLRDRAARRTCIGPVPVTALRIGRVGEQGWELCTTADLGLALWDTLWSAGASLGLIAAGRGAFDSLRLEAGYRAWGRDMTTEDTPDEAGLGFAVHLGAGGPGGDGGPGGGGGPENDGGPEDDGGHGHGHEGWAGSQGGTGAGAKGDFIGRDALLRHRETGARADRRLLCLTLDDPAAVVLGKEPVLHGGVPAGHVTSAGYGYTVGRCVAYAWLPPLPPGTAVHIEYLGEKLAATVVRTPLHDPGTARVRG
ncbi:GcvT family protein [Streptomyces sp. NPDC001889]